MSQLREKAQSMSAKEIILTMVDSLRNPVCEIDMDTFGDVIGGVCFGCAATNTIAKLLGYEELTPDVLGENFYHWPNVDIAERNFLTQFEDAINYLRLGSLSEYNEAAERIGIAIIPEHAGHRRSTSVDFLPILCSNYSDEELQQYENYANKYCYR